MLSYSNTCIISSIPLNKNEEFKTKESLIDEQQFKDCDSPQSGSNETFNGISIEKTLLNNSILGKHFLGKLFISLPDGLIIDCQNNNLINLSEEENQIKEKKEEEQQYLNKILIIGDSLFNYLYGKSAQTLLLNAFCGHSRRRMGSERNIRPCELICEFFNENQNNNYSIINTTRRLANIYIYSPYCNSISLLGHFPSEVTGGTEIVKSSGLRFLTYSGDSIEIESEWAAFVNPWSKHIEMVVGRHTFNISKINKLLPKINEINEEIYKYRDQQALLVQTILSEPIKNIFNEQKQINFSTPQQQQNYLSYNQINCIENVHRLLKSQQQQNNSGNENNNESFSQNIEINLKDKEIDKIQKNSFQLILTKELLQKHNQRLEEEYYDNWKNKLTLNNKTFLKRKIKEKEDEIIIPFKQLKKEFNKGNYLFENFINSKYSNNLTNNSLQYFEQDNIGLILKQKIKLNQQQNQQLIKQLNIKNDLQNLELIEQILQTINMSRNTLTFKLLQQQQQQQINK
ncbi:PAS domain-containing protein, partial [Meloidogyne graminicola]